MRPEDPSTNAAASGFGPATAAWFLGRFGAATAVQARGWPAIQRGEHALLCAPTGSGKTLAAFLAALDRLSREPRTEGVRVLYVSPLKALAHDVERNLRVPLEGIREVARALGQTPPEVRVAIRTGDTPARERRRLQREPADVLITTPESLYLLLGSEARRVLGTVETIIVDEIHALAPSKRGAHLALSLERLCAQIAEAGGRDPQRVGLSATQRPLEEVARFLGGARPVTIVDAGERPRLDLAIEVPGEFESVDRAGSARWGEAREASPSEGGRERPPLNSVWPSIHARVLELVAAHRSTIVFTNSRRLCERLAQRLNELWAEAGHGDTLVRAHHGSIAREQRVEIEEQLKAGRLRGLVATSSLELGIDMGAVDLVVQIESPGAVARGLQRVGRAGHAVGERSIAKILPKFQQDLLEATVVARAMLDGEVEPIRVPRNPLDVLAQQLVAMTVERPRTVEALGAIVRAAYPYQALPQALLVEVLDMLAGRYPSAELADLRPRVVWDRTTDQVVARKDARLVAIVNGGTIPDRGLYGVYLDGDGPRVGELDEEMVYESRIGQTFLLGASSWRIVAIERDRVIVRPAPGEPGRMPFWRGEGPGRPIELGRALGAFLRELEPRMGEGDARAWLQAGYALDARAAEALCRYLEAQRAMTGVLPTDRTLVVERFRDELGDWRVCLLSPFGARVHAPLSLALEAALAERGAQVQAIYSDDGVVLRLPSALAPPSIAGLLPPPEALEALLLPALRGSSLFASHFRQNAARALLLPRRRPGQRSPLWLQRQKAQTLLEVVGRHPGFPIVLETLRECLSDVFDVPALTDLLGRLRAGEVRLVEVETQKPSPFARSLAFAYVASYLYEGDAPVAERKAQALSLDQDLLRELLGEVEVRELLDAGAFVELEDELQRRVPERRVRSADGLHDLLRGLGDLSTAELGERAEGEELAWIEALRRDGRAYAVHLGGEARLVAVEDLALYRDALAIAPPPGVPAVYLAGRPDALAALLARHARTHTAFTLADLARRWGAPIEALRAASRAMIDEGRLLAGAFRPDGESEELCDPEVLRRLRRRTLTSLRRAIAPIDPSALARFLPAWHGIGEAAPSHESVDRLREALRGLEGLALPFAELEGRLLPARVAGYQPRLLDELGAAGEIVWIGRGQAGEEGLVAIYFREHVEVLAPTAEAPAFGPLHQLLLEALARRGAMFVAQLQAAAPTALVDELEAALWDLAWAGLISNDTFAPLRARARGVARPGARRGRATRLSPTLTGRWSLTARGPRDVTEQNRPAEGGSSASPDSGTAAAHAQASMLLDRYGLVTREAALAEGLPGGFTVVGDVLRAMEEAGRVRRGYFVEGLSGAQYALPGAVDRLRAAVGTDERALALSAIDPANPFGVFLDWPALDEAEGEAGRPRRVAGATVVLVGGRPVLFLERGGRRLLVFAGAIERPGAIAAAVAALAGQRELRVTEINGRPALRSRLAGALEQVGFRVEPGALVLSR